jgi:signal transduction histidine kinase
MKPAPITAAPTAPTASPGARPRRAGWARFLRTSTFRLTLLYAGLFCLSVLALLAFVYWQTLVLLERQQMQIIFAETNALVERYHDAGLPGLLGAIAERVQPDRVGDSIYLLADGRYEPVIGNLERWPRGAEEDGRTLTFPIERTRLGDPEQHRATAIYLDLAGDYHLLVGIDTRTQDRFRRAVIQALIWSIVATLGLGLGVGVLMSRRTLARLEAINQAAERVRRGEVKHRMPVGRRGDEYDRLAENLNAMLEEIERLLGAVRAVTNNIAHDLRSPLTRLKTRLEIALAASEDAAARREAIERALAEADELLATFNALLSIADAEAGTGRAEMDRVDLEGLARDVAELYEPAAEEKGLTLERGLHGPATITGNRQLLFQVLANLLDNAVKYTPSPGRIVLRLEPATEEQGPALIVADSGPGIPAEDRERVLERFVRLDASRSTPGSGLGLSLVAAIARLHAATLALDDNAPGLKVMLRFPRS